MKRMFSPMFVLFMVALAISIFFESTTAFICAIILFCTDMILLAIDTKKN